MMFLLKQMKITMGSKSCMNTYFGTVFPDSLKELLKFWFPKIIITPFIE